MPSQAEVSLKPDDTRKKKLKRNIAEATIAGKRFIQKSCLAILVA
jgi:hypothetical protein